MDLSGCGLVAGAVGNEGAKTKKRIWSLLLAVALTALTGTAQAKGSPYYIRVNRSTCTVTVYHTDGAGQSGEPFKAMICSVGKPGRGVTPTGTYTLTGYRPLWCRMKDGSYGQYVSQFKGNYLFHSVCYRQRDPGSLLPSEYNDLGSPASLGCIRLQTADAKWIYENCPAGTRVEIFSGTAEDDPLGTPAKLVEWLDPEDPNSGWDPTDPREENPWHAILASLPVAYPATQSVDVDGKAVELRCYALRDEKGFDTTYVRLRDLAHALNGTPAQFEVGFYGVVNIVTGWGYTPDGSEGAAPFSAERECRPAPQQANVNGSLTTLNAFTLTDDNGGGYTYYPLRELGEALGFRVDWSAQRGVSIETL